MWRREEDEEDSFDNTRSHLSRTNMEMVPKTAGDVNPTAMFLQRLEFQ
jgi:hypothetical protein